MDKTCLFSGFLFKGLQAVRVAASINLKLFLRKKMKKIIALSLVLFSVLVQAQTTTSPSLTATESSGKSLDDTANTSIFYKKVNPKFKFILSATPSVNSTDTESIQALTNFKVLYQVTNKSNINITQTFETLNASKNLELGKRELIDRQNFRAAYITVGLFSELSGIFGSKEIFQSFSFRKMSGDAVMIQKADFPGDSALLVSDTFIPFALNANLDLKLNTQIKHVFDKAGFESNTLQGIPSLSYSFNEIFRVYQSAGIIANFKDNFSLRRTNERLFLATGVGIIPTPNLKLDFNVNQEKAYYASPSSGTDVTSFRLYQSSPADISSRTLDTVSYESTITYIF